MKIYLVRHGDMAGDPFVCPTGEVSGCLSQNGIAQAEHLGKYMNQLQIDAAFSSPYGRALQTGQIALKGRGIPITIVPGLEEWHPATVADTEFEKMRIRDSERYAEQTWKTEQGEGTFDMYARIVPALLNALSQYGWTTRMGGWVPTEETKDKSVAIFAHGGSLNIMLSFILGVMPFPLGAFSFEKTGIAEITFSERQGVYFPALTIHAPQ